MAIVSKEVFDEVIRNKCRCSDFVHPWTTSCLKGCFGNGAVAILGAIKFSLMMHIVQVLYKGKNLSKKSLKDIFMQFVRVVMLSSTLCFLFMALTCLQRKLLGRFEYYIMVSVPAAIAGGLSLLFIPTYKWYPFISMFTNCTLETIVAIMDSLNVCKKSVKKEMLLFMLSNAGIFYFIRLWKKNIPEKPAPEFWFYYPMAVRKSELSSTIISHELEMEGKDHRKYSCPHLESCFSDILKSTWYYFSCGLTLGVLRSLVLNIKKPSLLSKHIFVRRNLQLGTFLGTYVMLAKATNCLLCRMLGFDSEYYGLPAGLLSGISYYFHPNRTICLAAFCFFISTVWSYYDINNVIFKGFPFQLVLFMFASGFMTHSITFINEESSKIFRDMYAMITNGESNRMIGSFLGIIDQHLKTV